VNIKQLTDEVEVVSGIYAGTHQIQRDATWFLLKLHEEIGELTQCFLMKTGQARDKNQDSERLEANFRSELADVLCQVLLLARHHDVDLQAEVERKWLAWNPDWKGPRAACR